MIPGEGPLEGCDACGFDSARYDRADTISSQRVIPAILAAASAGLDDAALHTRPDPATWSIVEYLDHVREVAFGNRMAIEIALQDPGTDLGEPPEVPVTDTPKILDRSAVLDAMTAEFGLLDERLSSLTDEEWRTPVVLGGRHHRVGWFARHVLHDGTHHLADIGRIRHGLGLGAGSGTGSIDGLHRSGGGVPKEPVPSAEITARGIEGDHQADRRHHGRPLQAICLWSAEVIEGLRRDGHPIHPGAAGENVTISGVDWAALLPGSRLDIGAVPMLVTAHAVPCAKNARWFHDRDFNRIHHDRNPGTSRLYAIPLAPGTVSVGDPVTVEPD